MNDPIRMNADHELSQWLFIVFFGIMAFCLAVAWLEFREGLEGPLWDDWDGD